MNNSEKNIVAIESDILSISNSVKEDKDLLDGYIKNLQGCIDGISAAWYGSDAAQKYVMAMKEKYCKELKELSESLESYQLFLSKVYSEYKKVDDNHTSLLSSVEV